MTADKASSHSMFIQFTHLVLSQLNLKNTHVTSFLLWAQAESETLFLIPLSQVFHINAHHLYLILLHYTSALQSHSYNTRFVIPTLSFSTPLTALDLIGPAVWFLLIKLESCRVYSEDNSFDIFVYSQAMKVTHSVCANLIFILGFLQSAGKPSSTSPSSSTFGKEWGAPLFQ